LFTYYSAPAIARPWPAIFGFHPVECSVSGIFMGLGMTPQTTHTSKPNTDDLRIKEIKELVPPAHVFREYPVSNRAAQTTYVARQAIHRILHGADDRLLVVIGPCSIHDYDGAMEYAKKLTREAEKYQDDLVVLMRVYFEKPRTTVGWKGLINDPRLDNTFRINEGIRLARKILLEINELDLPCATEFLDTITPQYTADLIAWGAIGARTTESQVHRELASGLSCPVGFKNGTDGNMRIAVDAIRSANSPHHFLSVTKSGHTAIVSTVGNEDCHVILRGGKEPNYDAPSVDAAANEIAKAGLAARLMVDFSHGNSRKQYKLQMEVSDSVATQLTAGEERIVGVMVESNLLEGRQDIVPDKPLTYGQSVTDACINWDDSLKVLDQLAAAVRARRVAEAAE
jgi:3-deoxy-7-phosphoheptulonate synthase